jgi:hypothetical protein
MPFATVPRAQQTTGRDKRILAIAGIVLLLVLAGTGIWAAVKPGSYGSSRNGCVTVTLPSTTGGALIHQCGDGARAMCRRAFASTDRVAKLTRPQCRLAGLVPAPTANSS